VIFIEKKLSLKIVNKKEELIFKKIFNLYLKEITKSNYFSSKVIKNNIDKIKINNGKINWILYKNKKIGFVVFYLNYKKLNTYIRDYFIYKKYRKKKIGSLIHKKIILLSIKKKFKFIKIDILNTNKKVIKFWKQLNFKKNGKSYYLKLKK